MSRSLVAAALAALIVSSGCAGALRSTTGMACDDDGRTRWARYDTPHASVVTDLDEPVARELAAVIEWSHQALRATSFKNLPPTPVRVLAITYDLPGYDWYTSYSIGWLADVLAFGAVIREEDAAPVLLRMRAADPRGNTLRPKGLTARERTYAVRMVTHVLSGLAIPSQPPWLARGLATYFGETRVDIDRVWVGIANAETLDLKRYATEFPLREMLALRGCELEELESGRWAALDYQSFLLVHYLATRRAPAFGDYLRRMVAGEEAGAAWKGAFPDLAPERAGGIEALELELHRYARQDRYLASGSEPPDESFEVLRRPLTCTEARVARMAQFRDLGAREALDHEAEQLLAEVPGQPDALLAQGELAPATEAPALLRAALAKGPPSARGWALLAEALPPGAERQEAAAKAGALGEGDPAVELRVAEARLDAGANEDAVVWATRAVTSIPWSVRGNAALARGLARQGKCAAAKAALRRTEACFSDRCPDRTPKPQEPRPLRELPRAQVAAARAEVEACGKKP